MPRKTTDKLIQFNKKNILETAENLFSEKGVRATTVDDISKAADCSKSTIYVYFKSKDEIHNCIIYDYMCQMLEMIDLCVKEYTVFEQCYLRICAALVQINEQHPLYFESMMGSISIDRKELEENEILRKIYEIGETINDKMIELFEKGVKEKTLKQEILILPAVYTLWVSLENTILVASRKEDYISQRMNMDKAEFLQYGFNLLLSSIKRG